MKVTVLSFLFIAMLVSVIFPFSTLANEESLLLNSESAILIDATTGEVLYEKNSTTSMYPASITKIVTGIIAIEEGNPEDVVTVSEKARNVSGTRVYLEEGEQVPLLKLVQGLLISSGNDAGIAIAEYFDGGEEAFAKRMNRFVKEKVGVSDTTFINPHGLFDLEHRTTAYDMAKIAQYAMTNEIFRKIVGTKEMEWVGEGWETTIYNHHQLLLRNEEITGVKNGYVPQAGYTLVTSADQGNGTELIVVTLKADSSEKAYHDTEELLDYGFEHYQTNMLKAKVQFEDQGGNKYELAEDVYFTSPVGEVWHTEIDEQDQLFIKTENEDVLLQVPLEQVDTRQTVQAQGLESGKLMNKTVNNEEPNTILTFFRQTFWIWLGAGLSLLWLVIRLKGRSDSHY